MIDVLDERGNKTGEVLSRKDIHQLGKIHRAVHLYLFDKANNLLLQRRSYNVDHYPGMLSISVTGHVDAGESSREAVEREFQEELGLKQNSAKIEFLFSLRQDAYLRQNYIDRQFNDIYVCWADFCMQDVALEAEAISEVKLVSFSEFENMVTKQTGDLVPVYKEACIQLVDLLKSRF